MTSPISCSAPLTFASHLRLASAGFRAGPPTSQPVQIYSTLTTWLLQTASTASAGSGPKHNIIPGSGTDLSQVWSAAACERRLGVRAAAAAPRPSSAGAPDPAWRPSSPTYRCRHRPALGHTGVTRGHMCSHGITLGHSRVTQDLAWESDLVTCY